jgi:hypothetical protein
MPHLTATASVKQNTYESDVFYPRLHMPSLFLPGNDVELGQGAVLRTPFADTNRCIVRKVATQHTGARRRTRYKHQALRQIFKKGIFLHQYRTNLCCAVHARAANTMVGASTGGGI